MKPSNEELKASFESRIMWLVTDKGAPIIFPFIFIYCTKEIFLSFNDDKIVAKDAIYL
jgi:hypothetical protein